jgi:signal transduction histidine kinase
VRVGEMVLGVGLVIGLGIIWWTAFRALGRQRRQLEEYLGRIESSNRDLDAFAARVAHDLRNALGPIALIAAGLREARERPDAIARMASQLGETVRRSRRLIDGLLAFSRPMQPADGNGSASVAAMVNDVLQELAPLVARVGAEVLVEVEEVEALCPPGLLHVVGVNLIGNAVKYLEGRPLRRVRVATAIDGEWVEFVVEDTGPGIPARALPHVGEPFFRVPETAVPGTGIGLATVRRIVEAHGGLVRVQSEVGRGSVFRVRLRLAGVPATRAEPAERLQPAG